MALNYTEYGDYKTSEHGLILVREDIGRPEVSARSDSLALYGLPDFDDYDIARNRRELIFEYVVHDANQWPAVFDALSLAIDGKKMKIVRAVEPDYFYVGRCMIDQMRSSRGKGNIIVKVNAEPYKYAAEYTIVTMSSQTQKTITPVTGYLTPAIVTITPANALTTLTLRGFARDRILRQDEQIILGAMTSEAPVCIDGEQHTVTVGGQPHYADVITQMWEWPSILPTRKIVTVTNNACSIEIKYRGRYI